MSDSSLLGHEKQFVISPLKTFQCDLNEYKAIDFDF